MSGKTGHSGGGAKNSLTYKPQPPKPPDPPDPISAGSQGFLGGSLGQTLEHSAEESQNPPGDKSANSSDSEVILDAMDMGSSAKDGDSSSEGELSRHRGDTAVNSSTGDGMLIDETHPAQTVRGNPRPAVTGTTGTGLIQSQHNKTGEDGNASHVGPHDQIALSQKKTGEHANASQVGPHDQSGKHSSKNNTGEDENASQNEYAVQLAKEMRSDVEFLKRGIRQSLATTDHLFALACVQRLEKKLSIDKQLEFFGEFPLNGHSLKLELENPNDLTKAQIMSILTEWCAEKKAVYGEETKRLYKTACAARKTVISMELEYKQAHGQGNIAPEKILGVTPYRDIAVDLMNAMRDRAQEYAAYALIPEGRLVDGILYLQAV